EGQEAFGFCVPAAQSEAVAEPAMIRVPILLSSRNREGFLIPSGLPDRRSSSMLVWLAPKLCRFGQHQENRVPPTSDERESPPDHSSACWWHQPPSSNRHPQAATRGKRPHLLYSLQWKTLEERIQQDAPRS